jgi:ferredoxin
MGRKPLRPIRFVHRIGARRFHLDEHAQLVLGAELDDAQRQAVQDAADSCPTQAITVGD